MMISIKNSRTRGKKNGKDSHLQKKKETFAKRTFSLTDCKF